MEKEAIAYFVKSAEDADKEGAAWARGGHPEKAQDCFSQVLYYRMAAKALEEAPEVFGIDMMVQLRVTPRAEGEIVPDGTEELLRFFTYQVERGDVIREGVKALRDRTHPNYVDWRNLPGFAK